MERKFFHTMRFNYLCEKTKQVVDTFEKKVRIKKGNIKKIYICPTLLVKNTNISTRK